MIRNLPGNRGIRLDFQVLDLIHSIYDVEMQNRRFPDLPQRTRFYQSMTDTPLLKSGENSYSSLSPSYIIVICCFDLFGYGKYRYTFENTCHEVPGLSLGDGSHKIILNTRGTDPSAAEPQLIDFLRYIEHSTDQTISTIQDPRILKIHKKVKQIKKSEEMEAAYMREQELKMAIFQDGFQNGRRDGFKDGFQNGRQDGFQDGFQNGQQDGLKRRERQIARKMLRDNMSLTLISKYTGLTEKEILRLMDNTVKFRIRVDSDIKKQCETLYNELGLSLNTAINVFLRQSLRTGGFPFEIRLK